MMTMMMIIILVMIYFFCYLETCNYDNNFGIIICNGDNDF